MSEFTIKDALKVQSEQLEEWKLILKPEVFNLLKNILETKNKDATNTNDIKRGTEIEMILFNQIRQNLAKQEQKNNQQKDYFNEFSQDFSISDYNRIKELYAKVFEYNSPDLVIRADNYLESKMNEPNPVKFNLYKDAFIEDAMKSINEPFYTPERYGMNNRGNGLTIYDRFQIENNDFKNIAHLSNENKITFYQEKLPTEALRFINEKFGNEINKNNHLFNEINNVMEGIVSSKKEITEETSKTNSPLLNNDNFISVIMEKVSNQEFFDAKLMFDELNDKQKEELKEYYLFSFIDIETDDYIPRNYEQDFNKLFLETDINLLKEKFNENVYDFFTNETPSENQISAENYPNLSKEEESLFDRFQEEYEATSSGFSLDDLDLDNSEFILEENPEYIFEDLEITKEQKKYFSDSIEFGTAEGYYPLTEKQLSKIPDLLEGYKLDNFEKTQLAMGELDLSSYNGIIYSLKENKILKLDLKNDSENYLKYNDIKFLHKLDLEQKVNNINPLNLSIMTPQETSEHLKKQVKLLGFGESPEVHKQIDDGLNSNAEKFSVFTNSDKAHFKSNKVDFELRFAKNEKGTFFNSYEAKLTNENSGEEKIQNVPVNKDTFTAKEVINLLEGRAVKKPFVNKENQQDFSFIRLNFKEKIENGNFKFANTFSNQVSPTEDLLKKVNFANEIPQDKMQTLIKSLEKGNVVKADFNYDGQDVKNGNIVLNPSNNQISLYNEKMQRLNPVQNQSLDNVQENEQTASKQNKASRSL